MPLVMHRTQILLEPEQHQALAQIAREEGRSISEVVRAIVRRELTLRREAADADLARRLEALERIRVHRDAILRARGGRPIDVDVVQMINDMREERDAEHLADYGGHRH